jgi:hypothetical protein
MRWITLLIIFVFTNISKAQGPIVTSLNYNAIIKQNANKKVSKRSLTDTLALPFFDDFTTTVVFPDTRLWIDNHVYVNRHFAVSPPSYGVATFDNLNNKGNPYQALSGNTHNRCDSLTSNPINLKDYKIGLNTQLYTLNDSIYLSFFYQMQGLGDVLDQTDSLVLKFKDNAGFWNTVWKTSGGKMKPFKQILVGIYKNDYLYNGFQFRFINYSKSTGNMNQWHLDYVRMATNRNLKDTVINDVAINNIPNSPLLFYNSMPYDHFKANPVYNTANAHSFTTRNNNSVPVNVSFACKVRNQYNQLLKDYPFSGSVRNVNSMSDTTEFFTQLQLDTLSSKNPKIHLEYAIQPGANDFTPSQYNSLGNNNVINKTLEFNNYFAYDDGTAEGGYGLDYGSLPSGPGYAAIKYYAFKSDTLRGISVFFNQSVADVRYKTFYLNVWTKLSEPPANNTKNDVIAKKMEIPTTVFADSINGFVNFIFDTAVILPVGDFYIGWQQNTNYILNVGYDNNYKIAQSGGQNTNLFYNLNGYWERVSPLITGAVMMRPLLGAEIKNKTSIHSIELVNNKQVKIYPNPSGNSNILNISSDLIINHVQLFNSMGQAIETELNMDNQLNIDHLNSGIYWLNIIFENNEKTIVKFIKS